MHHAIIIHTYNHSRPRPQVVGTELCQHHLDPFAVWPVRFSRLRQGASGSRHVGLCSGLGHSSHGVDASPSVFGPAGESAQKTTMKKREKGQDMDT